MFHMLAGYHLINKKILASSLQDWIKIKENNQMTLYWTTPLHRMARRHMFDRMAAGWDAESTCEVIFPVDVKAEDEAYVISALLPGVSAEDLDIQIVNDTVTIRGEMKTTRDEKDTYLLSERPSGKFSRVLNMPVALNSNGAEAHVENGVLTLRVPKAEAAKPKTIKVVVK
jgi:HSP20 family protein